MSLSKKIFIASAVLLAIVLIFWGIYNLSFKPAASPTPVASIPTQNTAPTPMAPVALPKIAAISDEAVLSPVLMPDQTEIKYYSKNTGQVYSIDLDGGNKKVLSSTQLPGLASIVWSPDTTKVISQIKNGDKSNFYYYDYTTNRATKLSDNVDIVAWQNNSKILYKYFDPKTKARALEIADPDGSNWVKIADIPYQYVSFAPIPKTGLISFWNSPDALTETVFQSTPIIGGELAALSKGRFGGDFLWNSDGSLFLSSSAADKSGSVSQLAVANDKGGEFKNLNIPTFVSKCAWSKDNQTVYYALPGNIPANAILPNEYLTGKFNTTDTFWKVNTTTGEKTRLIDLDKINGAYDATGLFLNADESILFFINRADGRLYRMSL